MSRRPGTPVVMFRSGTLAPAFAARARRDQPVPPAWNEVAARDLGRLYDLLEVEHARLAPTFSDAEWMLLRDACNGTLWETSTIRLLWAEVADAIDLAGLATKWGVDDPRPFMARLRALTPLQSLAVVDAIERWWIAQAGDGA